MQKVEDKKTVRKLYELIGVLSVQFILGVALTTVIAYDSSQTSLTQNITLWLHIFIGAYLLLISGLFLIKSIKRKQLVTESWLGLIAVLVAFGSGSIAAKDGNNWATLIMAVGFLVALLVYSLSLVTLRAQRT